MKVLADTNILVSALLWPHSTPALALFHVVRYHELVLSDRNLLELRDVLGRKAPHVLVDLEIFLAELAYELITAPDHPQQLISDPKDQPILNAAILADVDVIMSGDKHFLRLAIERPNVMTAAQFLTREGVLR